MKKRTRRETTEYAFTVLYEPVRGGGFAVTAPRLPGLVTFGRTFDEAREMARDAVICYLESLKNDREDIPSETSMLQERMTVAV